MLVSATGLDGTGKLRQARWSLLAEKGDGPQVPTLAAAAAVRAIRDGSLGPGARSAGGALSLSQIEAEMEPYALSTRIGSAEHGPTILETAVGDAAFGALPEPLRAFHGPDGHPVWHGRANVANGTSPVARLLRRIIGLPKAGDNIPVTVSVDRLISENGGTEIWTRNFGGVRFSSHLRLDGQSRLCERFGPVAFHLGAEAKQERVSLPVVSARFLGIPLPRMLLPRSDAMEEMDAEGRFRFDVKLTLPVFGMLVHYSGWLVPKQ
jgi:hypothetical protein